MGAGSRSTAFKELPASLFFLYNSKNKIKLGNGAEMSGAETEWHPVVQRRNGPPPQNIANRCWIDRDQNNFDVDNY